MSENMFSDYNDLLNTAVDGELEDFDIDLEEGTLKGENFLGDIVFVCLKNKKTKEERHLVIKKALKNLDNLAFLEEIYSSEINFYEEIWPTLNKFQENLKFNKIARCYASRRTEGNEALVLENLTKEGFQMFDKTKTLDKDHIEFIFKSYGAFHAISYAYREKHPEEFNKLQHLTNTSFCPNDDWSSKDKDAFDKFYKACLESVYSVIDETSEEHLLKAYKKYISEKPHQIWSRCGTYKGDSPMLIHGDCWSNNMLFKYDVNGKLIDMRFLDFQLLSCSTPANDLAYCLYSGASKDVLDQLDDLLKTYISSFQNTLEKLNCKPKNPYTYEKLKNEWKEYCKLSFLLGIEIWAVKLVDKDHIPTAATFGSLNIAEEHVEAYKQRIRDIVMHFYENGFM